VGAPEGEGAMKRNPHPDLELARRAAEGENAAWREIYDSTREKLFALVVYHVGDREEALDVLQETYASAVRGIRGYRGDGSLESWLCGIALRRARDWRRRAARLFRRTVPLEEKVEAVAANPGPGPDEGVLLRRAIELLPERQRRAFLLHEWMGYPFDEVARILGVAESTARVHSHRAKESLRKILRPDPTAWESPGVQEQRP